MTSWVTIVLAVTSRVSVVKGWKVIVKRTLLESIVVSGMVWFVVIVVSGVNVVVCHWIWIIAVVVSRAVRDTCKRATLLVTNGIVALALIRSIDYPIHWSVTRMIHLLMILWVSLILWHILKVRFRCPIGFRLTRIRDALLIKLKVMGNLGGTVAITDVVSAVSSMFLMSAMPSVATDTLTWFIVIDFRVISSIDVTAFRIAITT